MLGPCIQSRGTMGTEMSSNAALITIETCTTSGNNLKTNFSYMSLNVNKMYILGYDQTWPILLSSYPHTHKIWKQSDKDC